MKPAPSSDDGLARALFHSTPSSSDQFGGQTFGCPSTSFGHGAPHLARSFGQGIPPSTQGGASQSQSSTWSFITPSLSNPTVASALSNQQGFHPRQPTFNPQGYGSGMVSTPYFGVQGTGRGNPPSAFNSTATVNPNGVASTGVGAAFGTANSTTNSSMAHTGGGSSGVTRPTNNSSSVAASGGGASDGATLVGESSTVNSMTVSSSACAASSTANYGGFDSSGQISAASLWSSNRSSLGSMSNRSSLGSYNSQQSGRGNNGGGYQQQPLGVGGNDNSRQSLGGRLSDQQQQQPLGGGGIRERRMETFRTHSSNATQPPRSFQSSNNRQP